MQTVPLVLSQKESVRRLSQQSAVQMKSFGKVVAFRKAVFSCIKEGIKKFSCLFAAGVLGHRLGSLADCVLGQFTGEVQPHSCLDFPAGDGVFPVVVSQAGGLNRDTLKDVVHERVHDAHGLAGDAGVRVDLFQHLVDVDGVALLARLSPLLGFSSGRLRLGRCLLLSLLRGYFARHDSFSVDVLKSQEIQSVRYVRSCSRVLFMSA